MMPHTTYSGGIDVSQATLVAATFPETQTLTVPNTPDGWQQLLQAWQGYAWTRIIVESSGGYEQGVVQALRAAQLPVVVVPPQKAAHFARSLRPYLKTDAADARALARFGVVYEVPETAPASSAQAELKALWARWEQLVRMLEAEKKRLRTARHPVVQASIQRMIEALEAERAALEAALAALEASDAELAARGRCCARRSVWVRWWRGGCWRSCPNPCSRRAGEGATRQGLTTLPKVEQHPQQVRVVHKTVFVDVLVARVACTRRAKRK